MSLALQYHRSAGRYFAARAVSGSRAGGRLAGMLASNVAPLRLVEQADPVPADESWSRVEPALSGPREHMVSSIGAKCWPSSGSRWLDLMKRPTMPHMVFEGGRWKTIA